jgi:hypothetical protein
MATRAIPRSVTRVGLVLTTLASALGLCGVAAAAPPSGSNYAVNVIGGSISDPSAVASFATSVRRLGDLVGKRHFSWQLAAPTAVDTFPYANPLSQAYDWSRLDALACSAAVDLDGNGAIDPATEPNFRTFALLWPYNNNATFDTAAGCPGQGPSPVVSTNTCSYWNHPSVPAVLLCDTAICGVSCGLTGAECDCGDEADDDHDFLIDCDDPDCAAAPVCDLESAKGGTPFHCQACTPWLSAYNHFLEALFERYDVDGVDDVPTGPGQPCPSGWLGIHDWELVNEPENFVFSEGTDFRWVDASNTLAGANAYVNLAQQTRAAFNTACTGCSLSNGGLAFPTDGVAGGNHWLPDYFQGGSLTNPNDWWYYVVDLGVTPHFDGYSFHYVWFNDLYWQPNRANVNHYVENIVPSGWTPDPMRLTELALPAQWNGATDYVDCSSGASNHQLEVEEYQASAYLEMATLAFTEGVDTVSFLGLDLPQENINPGSTYGLRHCDGTPKAAYLAAQQMAEWVLWEPATPPQLLASQSCAVISYPTSGTNYCWRTDPLNHGNPPPQEDRVAIAQVYFPATGAYVFWHKSGGAVPASIPAAVLDPANGYTMYTAAGVAITGVAQAAAASCLHTAGTPTAQAITCLDEEHALVAYSMAVPVPVFGPVGGRRLWLVAALLIAAIALGRLAPSQRMSIERNPRSGASQSRPER